MWVEYSESGTRSFFSETLDVNKYLGDLLAECTKGACGAENQKVKSHETFFTAGATDIVREMKFRILEFFDFLNFWTFENI